MTFPRRWDKPQFKESRSAKVERFKRRLETKGDEEKEKREVRLRDKYCRFPLCGCRRMNLARAVAHDRHKGMGGNPACDRSKAAEMILLCSARHRENVIAWDRGTIRILPLTSLRYAGPCAFVIDLPASIAAMREGRKRWIEVGRETALHVFEPFTPEQERILKALAEMDL